MTEGNLGNENHDESRRERIRRSIRTHNSYCHRLFDSSDIIQETELQLWLSGRDPLSSDATDVDQAYIATLAKGHLAKNIRRSLAKKRDASRNRPITTDLASKEPTPIERLTIQEDANLLFQAVNSLEEVDQRIIFLRHYCDATFVEIEKELGLSKQRLQTRYKKAVQQIEFFIIQKQNGLIQDENPSHQG